MRTIFLPSFYALFFSFIRQLTEPAASRKMLIYFSRTVLFNLNDQLTSSSAMAETARDRRF